MDKRYEPIPLLLALFALFLSRFSAKGEIEMANMPELTRKRMSTAVVVLLTLGFVLSLAGCIEHKESPQTTIPDIIIGVDSHNPPAYRGNSTLVTLVISGINVAKDEEVSLDYKTVVLRTDSSEEPNPEGIKLLPEKKPLIFQRTIKTGEPPEKLYYNLTVNIDKRATEGDYFITLSSKSSKGKGRDSAFGSAALSFKIDKGRKSPLQDRNVWNIGYTKDMLPPLSEEEKTEAVAIVINASYLKDKRYEIAGVSSGFYELENFSGFFPVVTADIGEPEKPGSIMSYIIDMEEKKVLRSFGIPRKPFPLSPIAITKIQPDAGTIGTKVVITGTGFTAKDNNVAFRLVPEDVPFGGLRRVGYINNLISRDGKTIEFVIPEFLSLCAFPLPENMVCPDIAIVLQFKPGTCCVA